MLRPADTVVLFAVQEADRSWTIRSLAKRLGVPHAKVQRGLDRLGTAGIYDASRQQLVAQEATAFVVDALRFFQPLREGPMTRGVPTAWGAAPLRDAMTMDGAEVPVWPAASGAVRGAAVEPLDPCLPALVEAWPAVAELAALADGLRLGDARTRSAARGLLEERLRRRR